MRQRKLVIGLLVMLALVVSSFTYAYWASTVTVTQASGINATVEIGEGGSAATTVSLAAITGNPAAGKLVPAAFVSGDDFSSVTLTIPVTWTGATAASAGATGTLSVIIGTVQTIDANTSGTHVWSPSGSVYGSMFTITTNVPSAGAITVGSTVNVTVTIVFTNAPASKAIYDQVATGSLQIGLTFNVAVS